MLSLVGPPGSGKTRAVVDEAVLRLSAGRTDFRIITPTRSTAEHLRRSLARASGCGRPEVVTTLTEFARGYARDLHVVSSAGLHVLVDDVLRELNPPSFRPVLRHIGFRQALISVLQEFFTADASPWRLEKLLTDGVLEGVCAADFCAVFAAVDAELKRRRQGLRSHRLQRAAETLRRRGPRGLTAVYVDGFAALNAPELELIEALAKQVYVVVTLPDWSGAKETREALASRGFEERALTRRRAVPRTIRTAAPTFEGEVEEIARRVLECRRQGREWSDMAVLVRTPQTYVPALRASLARFGIPASFQFTEHVSEHPVVQYLARVVRAMLNGWDHKELLRAFEMSVAGLAHTQSGDELLQLMRAGLPEQGLGRLKTYAREAGFEGLVERLAKLDSWLGTTAVPSDWVRRAKGLGECLTLLPRETAASQEEARHWRGRARALQGLESALDETAKALGPERLMTFHQFWQQAEVVLEMTPLDAADGQRHAVLVTDVREARQWERPVVFLCGLLEGQFPAQPSQEPIFPEAVRTRLQGARLRVATLADQQEQERLWFDTARARATAELVLTYPQFNAKGDRNLVSFFLQDLDGVEEQPARGVRPYPRRSKAYPQRAVVYDEGLREWLGRKHRQLKPTAIESFLQCRFQFFARHSLKLQGPVGLPEERLGANVEGDIVHEVLARWHRGSGEDSEALIEEVFDEHIRERRVLKGFATEQIRLRLQRDLRQFFEQAADDPDWSVQVEKDFTLSIGNGIEVCGRIDRFDRHADGRVKVYDYKYSSQASLRQRVNEQPERYVQGGLYVLELRERGLRPESFEYYGLRGEVSQRGWTTPEALEELMRRAVESSLRVMAEVRDGRIEVEPTDPEACAFCEFQSACRWRSAGRARGAGQAHPA